MSTGKEIFGDGNNPARTPATVGDSLALAACKRMADVADSAMQARIEQAIAAGLNDLRIKEGEERLQIETPEARQLRNSARRADEIIAAIPDIIRTNTANKRSSATIMTLRPLESEERPGCSKTYLDMVDPIFIGNPARLRYAARLVFDYCERIGLKPYVYNQERKGQSQLEFEIIISWENPLAPEREPDDFSLLALARSRLS